MIHKWVVKAFQYIAGKFLQFLHRQIERLHQLFKLYLVNVLADNFMVASVTNDVYATEISYRRENSVRTI